jgi:hypothetical protein
MQCPEGLYVAWPLLKRIKKSGPPGRIRTCNLRLRRPLHYPVVLRAEGAQYPIVASLGQVKTVPTAWVGEGKGRLRRRCDQTGFFISACFIAASPVWLKIPVSMVRAPSSSRCSG